MPYVNIKESKIVGAIAVQVGNIQGILADKAYDLVNDVIQDVRRNACPTLPKANRLVNRVNTLNNQINGINRRIEKFRKIAQTITTLIAAIKIILRIIKKLPIPQSVPPGFGLPVAFSMIQADLLHKAKEKIKQGEDDAKGILEVIKTPAPNLAVIGRTLSKVSTVANGCRLEGVLRREVLRGNIRERTLNELGIVDREGNYIFSNVGATLFNNFQVNRDGSFFGEEKEDDARNADNALFGALQKLDGSGEISEEVKGDIKSLLDTFKDNEDIDKTDNPDYFHTGPNGTVYKLEIQIDPD